MKINKADVLYIPFIDGKSVLDSQLKPRFYKSKEAYDKWSHLFPNAKCVCFGVIGTEKRNEYE